MHTPAPACGCSSVEVHLACCPGCQALLGGRDGADPGGLPVVDTDAYEIDREVGRGGMGRVLAAHDRRVGRVVAIKELLDVDPVRRARFEREARLTASLQHPGIVPIYEIGRWPDGTPFFAMRLIEGRTLRAAIASAPELDARLRLLPALVAAGDAIAFAHARRIVHRDLTPANILIGGAGETVVIDWGLAKDLATEPPADAPGARLTHEGSILGTAAYMPPEQASGLAVDERADVYALGAILYQVVAGVAPYRGDDAAAVLRRVRTGAPPDLAGAAPRAPRPLISVIARAMARDPDARYPSVAALVAELVRFLDGRQVDAHRYPPRERARAWLGARRPIVLASLCSLAVGIAAGIGGWQALP